MHRSFWLVCSFVIVTLFLCVSVGRANPTANDPLEMDETTLEVKVFGTIYPARFNDADGEEAHYHLLVWRGGTSANALIETPADDLAFHDALMSLGARPGDNLTMASWNKRYDPDHPAPKEKVEGSSLDIRLSWKARPLGIPIEHAFPPAQNVHGPLQRSLIPNLQPPIPSPEWRFGGNRDRWFNTMPLTPRPGCLVCLYSCPSGKVSNGALSVHEYVEAPSRFVARTAILPPDGTPVILTFRLRR